MRQFYVTYSSEEFLSQAVEELGGSLRNPIKKRSVSGVSENLSQAVRELVAAVPWGHHANVLAKIENPAERLYYLRATANFGWTRSVLQNQVKADAYGRSLAEGKAHNFPTALPEYLAEQAKEALKSSYNLEFLGICREYKRVFCILATNYCYISPRLTSRAPAFCERPSSTQALLQVISP